MIGLDTNILVRYITGDDSAQTAAAIKLIDSFSADSPGFISLIAIAELAWVLEDSYRFSKKEIEHVLDILLQTAELVIERSEVVSQALRRFRASNADFADCLIELCGDAAKCEHTFTFDKKAARTAAMRLLG
jgi:predicted nucleic-acid-binding protein